MAAPIVYKSTDASAPTLTVAKGSLITVLKACLVDGYGSKAGAGWSIELEDAPNYKIIFQNDIVSGTGRYFRVQDNGKVTAPNGTGSKLTYTSSERACNACVLGMRSYTDIDTPVTPFPRLISGGNLYDEYAYGLTIRKGYSPSNPSYAKPWMIIADNRTCYLFTYAYSGNSTTIPTDSTIRSITAFGDIRKFNPSDTTTAGAFCMGGLYGQLDIITSGLGEGSVIYLSSYYFSTTFTNGNFALDKTIDNGAYSVYGWAKPNYLINTYGGSCKASVADGEFMRYPSPLNLKAVFQPLIACEYTNDPIRTYKYLTGRGVGTECGVFPGLYGCPHTTSNSTGYRIGDELSEFTQDGKTYLLHSLFTTHNDTDYSQLLAFDLGDWWA